MKGFSLLQDDIGYRKILSEGESYWEGGIQYGGEPVITYEEFPMTWEPYKTVNVSSSLLPEGTMSKDVIFVSTDSVLNVAVSVSQGLSTEADTIYLQSPDVDENAYSYVVWDRAETADNKGFSLLGGYNEYICIRDNKI